LLRDDVSIVSLSHPPWVKVMNHSINCRMKKLILLKLKKFKGILILIDKWFVFLGAKTGTGAKRRLMEGTRLTTKST